MLTRRALLSSTAQAFAGAALASMMRWWPKPEDDSLSHSDELEFTSDNWVCTEIDLDRHVVTYEMVRSLDPR